MTGTPCVGCGTPFLRHHVEEGRCPSCVATIILSCKKLPTQSVVALLQVVSEDQAWRTHTTPGAIVSALNDALRLDREAVSALFATRMPCNDTIASHPTIQVMRGADSINRVGPLGILNSVFGAHRGWGRILMVVDSDNTTISEFRLVTDDDIPEAANG